MKKCFYTYVNITTGELLTRSQMLKQAAEEYDMDDFTNILELTEYYEKLAQPIPVD